MTMVLRPVLLTFLFLTTMWVCGAEAAKPFRFTGDFTASIRVRYPDGMPACVGKPYSLVYESGASDGLLKVQFGNPPRVRVVSPAPWATNVIVAAGIIGTNGVVEI